MNPSFKKWLKNDLIFWVIFCLLATTGAYFVQVLVVVLVIVFFRDIPDKVKMYDLEDQLRKSNKGEKI